LDGVSAAGDGQLAVAEGRPAGGAHGEGVEVGAAAVLEDDGVGAGVAVAVAPLVEGEQDRLELPAGVGEQVLVARGWSE
jgi:hypothetical protein